MSEIFSGIACNLDSNILKASIPLFTSEKVGAIEWSFDSLYELDRIPDWFAALLHEYSNESRLVGHGIFFSLFAGRWNVHQQQWLDYLAQLATQFKFQHIAEHFGFMSGVDFHHGAPLPVPFTNTTLQLGQDRLKRMYNHGQCPVGIENLAISFSADEVKKHGLFLEKLVEPVHGFIILDLHNLYCQLHNFNMHADDLLRLYPLHLVREIHISGGSWDRSANDINRTIRRDTHDGSVPKEVFALLELVLNQCPNLQFVMLEQLGTGLETEISKTDFANDFFTMEKIILKFNEKNTCYKIQNFLPPAKFELGDPLSDETLSQQQLELSGILETCNNLSDAKTKLSQSSLANSDWNIETWDDEMVEVAVKIAKKWKKKERF